MCCHSKSQIIDRAINSTITTSTVSNCFRSYIHTLHHANNINNFLCLHDIHHVATIILSITATHYRVCLHLVHGYSTKYWRLNSEHMCCPRVVIVLQSCITATTWWTMYHRKEECRGGLYIQSRLSTTRPVITLIGYKAVAGVSRFFGR